MVLLVVKPPELSLLHAHLFAAAHQHASPGTLKHQMEAVAKEVIGSLVDMTKDLRVGLQSHDRGARKMAVHSLPDFLQEGKAPGKEFRSRGGAVSWFSLMFR